MGQSSANKEGTGRQDNSPAPQRHREVKGLKNHLSQLTQEVRKMAKGLACERSRSRLPQAKEKEDGKRSKGRHNQEARLDVSSFSFSELRARSNHKFILSRNGQQVCWNFENRGCKAGDGQRIDVCAACSGNVQFEACRPSLKLRILSF